MRVAPPSSSDVGMTSISREMPSVAVAAQSGRVFVSEDGGLSWIALNDEGRMNEYPVGVLAEGQETTKVFALLSRSGVVVQGAGSVRAAPTRTTGRNLAPPKTQNSRGYLR